MKFFRKKDSTVVDFLKKARKFDSFESAKYEEIISYLMENCSLVEAKKLGLKLAVISDTHGDLAFGEKFRKFMLNIEEYDLCIVLGDVSTYELDKITELVPINKIIALRGNHDRFDVYHKHGITNINGKVYTCKGIRIAGIEGSNRYKNEKYPLYTHYESLKLAYDMPQKADILISHDCIFTESKYDKAHEGMAGLSYYVYKNNVMYHIHGHIHKSYRSNYPNGTEEISVYGCEYIEI
ncbi:MAG: metallophosphoesterase family protein [Clostridia bacterium]|nr:metallophosphoesterase family protein [Clostridia bacterium]